MDARDAIAIAKEYIVEVFTDEGLFNVGLEEIEFNKDSWSVTIGFSRRWDKPRASPFSVAIGQEDETAALRRTYKIIEIDDETGMVTGLRNRVGLM